MSDDILSPERLANARRAYGQRSSASAEWRRVSAEMFPALIDAYERERHETQRLRALIRAYASHICAHEGIGYLRPADETAELTDSQFRELQIMCNGQTGLAK